MSLEINFTLLADGSSDEVLITILMWVIRKELPNVFIEPKFADLRRLPKPPKSLEDRMLAALKYYPCDILFVHRDAETKSPNERELEVGDAYEEIKRLNHKNEVVAVVPVRMSETWLLSNTDAIRAASGNPNGKIRLKLPPIDSRLEEVPSPKKLLHSLMEEASELRGRNLAKLNVRQAVHLVAEYTEDFTPLRNLPAFRKLEEDLKTVLSNYPTL